MAACWTCGGETTTPRHHYCDWCRAEARKRRDRRGRDQVRANTTARGYGSAHQRARLEWAPRVEAGEVNCRRCGRWIAPGSPWHMGHDDFDRTLPAEPEHRYCNVTAPAKKRRARAMALDASRSW